MCMYVCIRNSKKRWDIHRVIRTTLSRQQESWRDDTVWWIYLGSTSKTFTNSSTVSVLKNETIKITWVSQVIKHLNLIAKSIFKRYGDESDFSNWDTLQKLFHSNAQMLFVDAQVSPKFLKALLLRSSSSTRAPHPWQCGAHARTLCMGNE